jgi:hypothetical protein
MIDSMGMGVVNIFYWGFVGLYCCYVWRSDLLNFWYKLLGVLDL